MQKKKIIVLSDHALSTSGVGTQTRHLLSGLIKKGEWTFRQFGAAMKHSDYRTVVVNEDFIIKPIDGFGSRDMIRVTLATEKPDAILIFTDPRFFIWLFEMEDEVHQMCPILWWHVWDNYPYPKFNETLYQSTDLINCHSHMTYEMLKDKFPDKTNFIPHAIPGEMFFPFDENQRMMFKKNILGPNRQDHFVGIWVNRNARRKRASDVLHSWKLMLDNMQAQDGHKKATLIMHTDPNDQEGPNLFAVAEELGIVDNVFFSRERIDFDKMNILYNISDVCINISYAEGFGLGTLEAMQAGTPIAAVKTGGLTRQVVDHRDGSENGVALPVECKTLVGSQLVPFIYEDYVTVETTANGLYKMFKMSPDDKIALRQKVRNYALSEFSYQKTIDDWHDTMKEAIENWRSRSNPWEVTTL
jgi:glycosyltransferase involved in cell wall biosynthesis